MDCSPVLFLTAPRKVYSLLFSSLLFLFSLSFLNIHMCLPCVIGSDDEEEEQLAKEISKDWNTGKTYLHMFSDSFLFSYFASSFFGSL